ncbi:GPI mannosyltransferase 2-like [Oppia nitens]|uniref:GPI mannosyltransferase 2-like n=1 Tax=Oppia nitens TaxID=1686743 RepID=UPI0023DBA842|nr:GPI mannosyltransferase 2-like [Oppia nitens]
MIWSFGADDRVQVVKTAAKSRLLLFVLQLVANLLIPDHRSDGFLNGFESELKTRADRVIHQLFIGLNRWDSQYFMAIAYNGYTREEFLAFFPLFPLLVRWLANLLAIIVNTFIGTTVVSYYSLLLISSFTINFLLFILTAIVLYELTVRMFASKPMARMTVYWFAYNPSSIFFSSSYSECLFAFLTFAGIYWTHMTTKWHHLMLASVLFGLSSAVRSNGLISFGFILYRQLSYILNDCFMAKRFHLRAGWLPKLAIRLFQTLVYVSICVIPFLIYQIDAYDKFCTIPVSTTPSYFTDWCNHTVPLSYSYVQNKYWNVGFLQYYQFKQIPNFLLALPIVIINLTSCIDYLVVNKDKLYQLLSLKTISTQHQKHSSVMDNEWCFVHIIHVLCLTLFCLFFVHIQVTTRMLLSSSPLVYWTVESRETKVNARRTKLVKLWFYGYFIVGTVMHSNFLPFT